MRLEDEIMQTKPFENPYHKASINLIYTGKWIISLHNELFQLFNLTLQQYNILRILKGRFPKPVTLKYIRTRLLDKMSDASRIVEVMHKKELLNRNYNPADRRKVDISLTKKGIDIISEVEKHHKTLFNHLSTLNVEEVNQLNFLLDKARG